MASSLRPVKLLIFLGAPVVLYAAGYYIVGPRIGARVPQKVKSEMGDQVAMLNQQVRKIVTPTQQAIAPSRETEKATATPTAPVTTGSTTPDGNGPEVEVSVRSQNTSRTTGRTALATPVKKHKAHRKPKPKAEPKPPPPDEGSYGGTQDQGTTTTGGTADPPTGG